MATNTSEIEGLATKVADQDLILVIFIHGFKGTDGTFGEFPKRLQHILSEAINNVQVESILFPAYEVCLQVSW
jgi:hypothetical protein